MSADERDPLHEMLCAYLLGEATDEERAQVEAALADSPELRAEFAQLEGTIGLVRDAFPADETLSEEALATLMAAAGDAHGQAPGGHSAPSGLRLVGGPAWHQAPIVRAAAAILAMLGGVLGALQYPSQSSLGDHVATADERVVPKGEAVRLLLDEVARVRTASDARFQQRAAKLATLEVSAEPLESTAYLRFAHAALEQENFELAYKWAEQARGAHQGNADLDLALRLIERQDADALSLMVTAQERRGMVFSIQPNEEAAKLMSGVDLDFDGKLSELYQLEGSSLSFDLETLSADGSPDVMVRRVEDRLGAVERGLAVNYAPLAEGQQSNQLGALVAGGEAPRTHMLSSEHDGQAIREKEAEPSGGLPSLGVDVYRARTSGQPASPEPATGSDGAAPKATGNKALDEELKRKKSETQLSLAQPNPAPARGAAVDRGGVPSERGRGREQLRAEAVLPPEESQAAVSRFGEDRERAAGEAKVEQRLEDSRGVVELGEASQDASGEAILLEKFHWESDANEAADSKGYRQGGYDESNGMRSALVRPQIEQQVEERFEAIKVDSLPRPGEQPHDMFYRWWGDNPFVLTERDRLATFGVDVDTASYALARRYLNDGYLPEKAQIRTEEFVNYFRPDLAPPTNDTFAITTELAPSPFGGPGAQKQLLRVGVRGKEVQNYERKPLVLTFVVDTSGSMRKGDRLGLVKHAMGLLMTQLDSRDMVGVVTYSKEANELLPPTSASNRGLFDSLVGPLQPNGGTNAEAGLQLGYEVAARAFNGQADNRVVFLSDGVANIGETDQDRINESIERHRAERIYLNTIGVGMENHNDAFLEQLADKGDGICDYIDDARAAERAIVERFSGAFTPIASDVKIQVDFDPTQVLRYRLLGYENRAIADVDFRNDAVDAGEVGAGHQVTALFEVERSGYGTGAPLAEVRLRWLPPVANSGPARELAQPVYGTMAAPTFSSASTGFQRAALAAQLAEFLRRSEHAAQDSYPRFLSELQRVASLPALVADADTQELLGLGIRAGELRDQAALAETELEQTVDDYRRYRYLREELRGTEERLGPEDRRALESAERELESRLRELLREEVSGSAR